MWLLPYYKVSRFAEKFSQKDLEPCTANPEKVKLIVEYINSTSRFVPSASCLVRALAAKTLLGMQNYGSELRIGVEKTSNTMIAAHAWLEIDGEIIIGNIPGHERYKVLETFSPTGKS